jgi:uncharacterized RDD family membrane protein YckC
MCSTPNRNDAKFCRGCGNVFHGTASVAISTLSAATGIDDSSVLRLYQIAAASCIIMGAWGVSTNWRQDWAYVGANLRSGDPYWQGLFGGLISVLTILSLTVGAALLLHSTVIKPQIVWILVAVCGAASVVHFFGLFRYPNIGGFFSLKYSPHPLLATVGGLVATASASLMAISVNRPALLTTKQIRSRVLGHTPVLDSGVSVATSLNGYLAPSHNPLPIQNAIPYAAGIPVVQMPGGFGLASHGKRFVAGAVVDTLAAVILIYVELFAVILLAGSAGSRNGELTDGGAILLLSWFVLPPIFPLLNQVVYQGKSGKSVGKRIMGLRLIREDGSKVSIGVVFARFLLSFLFGLITCGIFGLIDLIILLTDVRHQRLVDRMLHLLVVDDRFVHARPMAQGATQ